MKFFLLTGLFLALLAEGVITSLPLVLMIVIISASSMKSTQVYWWAFLAGIVLDVMTIKPLGQSSMFFLIVLFLISLYERKFEISSSIFVSVVLFFASSIYFVLSQTPQIFLQSLTVTIIGFVLFTFLERFFLNKSKQFLL